MTEPFDPYFQWLDIPAAEQPPNHYRLLGISLFESDSDVINSAADRQMARLRGFQLGKHSQLSQKLLSEIAAARRCLLDSKSRIDYEAGIRGSGQPAPSGEDNPPSRRPAPPAFASVTPPETRPAEGPPTAAPAPPRRRRRAYHGFLMWTISIVTVICAFILVTQSFMRRGNARKGPPPIELPVDASESLAGKTVIVPDEVIAQGEDGHIELSVSKARFEGSLPQNPGVVEWNEQLQQIRWDFLVSRPGFFMIEVTYAADPTAAGNTAEIDVADRKIEFLARDTGGWQTFITDETKMVLFRRGGRYQLTMRPLNVHSDPIVHLKTVRLRRTSAK